MSPPPVAKVRAWWKQAYRTGYEHPDAPAPYKKGTTSHRFWERGRQARLMGWSNRLVLNHE